MNAMRKFLLTILALIAFFGTATAGIDAEHKLAIQISTEDTITQEIALNYASNILNYYETGEVKMEVIAYGPGINIMFQGKNNKLSDRISKLIQSGVTFSACNDTLKKIEKTQGKKSALIDGVKVVTDGMVRIMTLQEKGYSYIRP